MDVVIAAGGESSRFKTDSTSDHKALFEIEGKPLIAHVLDGLRVSEEIARVVIVGANGSVDSERIYEYVKGYVEQFGVEVDLVRGERMGYGYALLLGSRAILENESTSKILMMPCDTILKRYAPLLAPVDVALATVPWPTESCKYSTISCNTDGSIDFSPNIRSTTDLSRRHAFSGVFSLSRRSLEKFEDLVSQVVSGALILPNTWNSNHELRISWIWPELECEGHELKAVDTGSFAELNLPAQIPSIEAFIREQLGRTEG